MAQYTSGLTLIDYSGEKSTVRIYNGPINAGTYAGYVTAVSDLFDAIMGIALGTRGTELTLAMNDQISVELPTDANAQRERKWLVTYKGNTSEKLFRLEIPTADITGGHLLPNQDIADLTDTDMAAFVTAFEALARTPDDSAETVTVLSIRHVGRNV